jgi:hypothetical protein
MERSAAAREVSRPSASTYAFSGVRKERGLGSNQLSLHPVSSAVHKAAPLIVLNILFFFIVLSN